MPKTPPPNNKRCTEKTKNGKGARCINARIPGDDKCFAHSPKVARQRAAARKKGGKNAHKPMQAVDKAAARLAFAKSMDVIAALEDVFDKVSKGEIDYRIGQTLGMLGSTMLKGLQYKESDDQDARIAELAKRLEEVKRTQVHANKNGQVEGAGQDRAVPPQNRGREDPGEDTPGWLPDDEAGGDGSGPLAGEDAAEPLWNADAD